MRREIIRLVGFNMFFADVILQSLGSLRPLDLDNVALFKDVSFFFDIDNCLVWKHAARLVLQFLGSLNVFCPWIVDMQVFEETFK